MSWPSSIYVVSMRSIFDFHPHFCYNQSFNLIFCTFLEYFKLVLDDNMDEESE